ncbi:MAG: cupin domain-containing protein [Cyanobacteria bacterium J06642_2]
MQHPLVLPDLLTWDDRYQDLPWQPFRPGVDIHYLYRAESGASAALLRYQPGAQVPQHRHTGHEHIIVLSGSQSDERDRYSAGTVVINPPDTEHDVMSVDGCIVLIIWEKPVELCP